MNVMDLNGLVVTKIVGCENGSESMEVHLEGGKMISFFHQQDCCENVWIDDVCGIGQDLVGQPLNFEDVSNSSPDPSEGTWTFYKFRSINGDVTVRWLGISNGYYSEYVTVLVSDA